MNILNYVSNDLIKNAMKIGLKIYNRKLMVS